ncbi:hypothetical protein QQ045_004159 [Rhodiola kirilowii]
MTLDLSLHLKSVAVAVADENCEYAMKWAVDHLLIDSEDPSLIILHVLPRRQKTYNQTNHFYPDPRWSSPSSLVWDAPEDNEPPTEFDKKNNEAELEQLFKSYRIYSARKGVKIKEVVLEDNDVSKVILSYIKTNHISNVVVGSTKGKTLSKWMKIDVPTTVLKNAPEFCSVYVVSKTKLLSVKQAQRPAANTATPPKMPSPVAFLTSEQLDIESSKGQSAKPGHRSTFSNGLPSGRDHEIVIGPAHDRLRSAPVSMENIEFDISEASSFSCDSYSDDNDASRTSCFGAFNVEGLDFYGLPDTASRSSCSIGTLPREVEAEMRMMKLELKQTMEMYNNACKEAICAKKKAKELEECWREETCKLEEARQAEERTRLMMEKEKRKYKVAIEAAEAAKKLAEIEAERRKNAESKFKEAENLILLSRHDLRYRKYTIEDIEAATENFSDARKIGEGGYGPVFKGYLDHTPVAIKVLRPDSTQGKKQFQQEIEVLSCIRHPNMVLLIGACPEHGCLVYEYMDNGNLEDRLFRREGRLPLSWRKRFNIAAQIATTLAFLHQSKPEPIVHHDLKPANILLDCNYMSKISDVGLARLVPPSAAEDVTQYHITSAAGTFCYMDPEYQQTGILTTKSDIYSLGVLLLQIITGRPPKGLINDVEAAIASNKFEEILDPSVTDWPVEEALTFTKLAMKCTELKQKDRPDLSSIIVPELNRFRYIRKNFGSGRTPSQSSLASGRSSSSCSTMTDCSQASTLFSYGSGSNSSFSPSDDNSV